MVDCLQQQQQSSSPLLDELMQRHLWEAQAAPVARCAAIPPSVGDVRNDETTRQCIHAAGRAVWTPRGPVDAPGGVQCGRQWLGTPEVRCLFAGRDVLFMGNSVTRRQMYTVLDLLAGRRAHRQRSRAPLDTIDLSRWVV